MAVYPYEGPWVRLLDLFPEHLDKCGGHGQRILLRGVIKVDAHASLLGPADDFIGSLPIPHQVAIDNQIELLNRLGPGDPPPAFPHSSQIAGELRELRCHYGRELYRILYRRSHNLFVLLHVVSKRSQRLPEADIALALARWEDFKARMDAPRRTPPRAAGHDAPR